MGGIENSAVRLVDGLVDGVLGGLFGGGGGGGDNSGELINLINQTNASNNNSLRALLEQNEKSLNDRMQFFTEFMQTTKEENQKKIQELRNELKQKDKEYENLKKYL